MAKTGRVVLFSGGGTAGHLAPGFALASALEERGVRTLFATPGTEQESAWFDGRASPHRIPAARLPHGLRGSFVFLGCLARGVLHARRILKRERVGCVVALGGWPCVPAVAAARTRRCPLVFLVPDAVPGLVIRKLAGWAKRIYVTHPHAAEAVPYADRVVQVRPLLRSGIATGYRDPGAFPGLVAHRRTLFVTGGSLGSRGLNERIVAGLEGAVEEDPSWRDRLQVLHAAGPDASSITARYEALGLGHHVTPYVQAMGTAYRTADLVVCRAGANTCDELVATSAPAVLVPYPHHADRQQFLNAERLVDAGAGRLIEEEALTPARVRDEVLPLVLDDDALQAMRAGLGRNETDGAAEAARDLVRFLGWDEPPPPPG